jgi:hypothetical protein
MPGPFIFVATNKVREGRLEGEKQRVPGWVEFIQSNEPRLIAFHEYLSEDGTQVEYVQVHPDTGSFEDTTNQEVRCHHTWLIIGRYVCVQSLSTGPPIKKSTPRDPRRVIQNPDYY